MPATEQYWRPLGTVHKVFAASALLLLLATLVMTAWDQNREWKKYQRESEELRNEQLEAERAAITSGSYESNLKALNESIQQAQAGLADKADQIAKLEAEEIRIPELIVSQDIAGVEQRGEMRNLTARGIVGGEAGWVLADNERMTAPIEAVGGEAWKRYRLYRTP